MDWARTLAYVTGTVDQKLLAWSECLAAESRIVKAQLKGQPKLSDAQAQNPSTQTPAGTRTSMQTAFAASSLSSAITCRDNGLRAQSGPMNIRSGQTTDWPKRPELTLEPISRLGAGQSD